MMLLRLLCLVVFVWTLGAARATAGTDSADNIILLLPDATSVADPLVSAWLDAGREEGLHVVVLADSEFLRLGAAALDYAGVILPDQVHARASDALVGALQQYVAQGGKLMLVFDAGVLTDAGFFASPSSRFSALVGVDYALYDELLGEVTGIGAVMGGRRWMRQLQVPPGKSMPVEAAVADEGARALRRTPRRLHATPADPGGLRTWDHKRFHRPAHERVRGHWRERGGPGWRWRQRPPTAAQTHQIVGYFYGALDYPSYVTRGDFPGTTLLSSASQGLVAGQRTFGGGEVLFVNLPLGYLKGQTDGMLLHGFLHYFATEVLQLPILAAQPGGVPGMIVNWHVDDGAAIGDLERLSDLRGIDAWKQGPFSIHLTAGPDRDFFGDGLGMDLVNNELAKWWVRYWDERRHQIGSHGGWIHDYFGINATEDKRAEFEPLLDLNLRAIRGVLPERRIVEYSAPQGNTPKWSTAWMQRNGFLAYYFTGHTGMGPTRAYRDGAGPTEDLWAMPLTTYGSMATFEEFGDEGVGEDEAAEWLTALADFAVRERTVRMVYFHPPGAADYPEALRALLERAQQYDDQGAFRWYTMARLARFLNERERVSWTVRERSTGTHYFAAEHPQSLRRQAWRLLKARYARPVVLSGSAEVIDDGRYWLVAARDCARLEFKARDARKRGGASAGSCSSSQSGEVRRCER